MDEPGQRRVRAEKCDSPAVVAVEREPEADQPDVVELAGRAREHGETASIAVPTLRNGEQAPADDVRREMLLRPRDLAALPLTADVAEARKDDELDRLGEAQVQEAAVEHVRGAGAVVGGECGAQA